MNPATEARPPTPLPARIGRYRVTGRIGRGAMGIVYSAVDEAGVAVAIKVMMADLEEDTETRERFVREAQIATRLRHRHLIMVLETGEEDGRLFIAMELLRGQPLPEFLRTQAAVALETRVDLMTQTCEGLAAAHAAGVIHRDVKPGNLFVQEDGSLKLLDFGVARLANSNITTTGSVVGTPDYMSPEQVRGDEIDGRSDVFSAGAVFYYVLTQRKPFAAPELPVVLHKVQFADPLPLRESEAPPPLAAIVRRALEKDAARRYPGFTAVLSDLVSFRRQYDADTRALAVQVREQSVESARLYDWCEERERALGTNGTREPVVDPALLELHPVLMVKGLDALGVVPFHRRVITALADDVRMRLERVREEVALLDRVADECARADAAAAAGDVRGALALADAATRGLPDATAPREAASRLRGMVEERDAFDQKLEAARAAARSAAAEGAWEGCRAIARDVCAIAPDDEMTLLERRASERIEQERRDRERMIDSLMAGIRDAVAVDDGQNAVELLARLSHAEPGLPELVALGEAVDACRARCAAADARTRVALDGIGEARALAAAGDMIGAEARLERTVREFPFVPAVVNELTRARAERQRREEMVERQAKAVEYRDRATAALEAGRPAESLPDADRALALEPNDPHARRMFEIARSTLEQQATRTGRADEIARILASGRRHQASGRDAEALDEVERAVTLDPTNACAVALRDTLRASLAAQAHAAGRREAQTRARRAAAPALTQARKALGDGDFERALWAAENALALAPDWPEAAQARAQAAEALATRTADDDDTVVPRPGDTEDTVALAAKPARIAWAVGAWTVGLLRRARRERGQTTVEGLMIAGVFVLVGLLFLQLAPRALVTFFRGIVMSIRTVAL